MDSVIFIVYCKYVQMECSGTLVIQSCLRYGDMENRMPCNPLLSFTNVDKLLKSVNRASPCSKACIGILAKVCINPTSSIKSLKALISSYADKGSRPFLVRVILYTKPASTSHSMANSNSLARAFSLSTP